MHVLRVGTRCLACEVLLITLLASSGCGFTAPLVYDSSPNGLATPYDGMPRELSKVILPTYRIEPPDILSIDAVHVVPRSPYYLRALDVLSIEARAALPDAPIAGAYPIGLGGKVNLGDPYGSVNVSGMTLNEAEKTIEEHLADYLATPSVVVNLVDIAAKQQITGEHLVAPDGTVTLGSYGSVLVVGQTLAEAKRSIEAQLARALEEPEVSVNVFAYNSKVYYVITQGAGLGDGVYRFPITGNETVLDAISNINGLESVSSKRIWISRPTGEPGNVQVLPVRWEAVTAQASTESNYQVLPGDRIFIAEDKLVALDNGLAKLIAPFERVMGFALLGAETVTRFAGPVLRGGGNPTGRR